MRLFVCLRPPAAGLEHLAGALGAIAPADPDGRGLRWVPPEQRHVTLAFYGDVPEGAVPDLVAGLGETAAEHRPLVLELAGAGAFHGQALWVGVREIAETGGLTSLMAACGELGAAPGARAPRERVRAHLTVARMSGRSRRASGRGARRRGARGTAPGALDRATPRAPQDEVAALARALAVYRGPQWSADRIELVHSRLGEGPGGGPVHEPVATVMLGRA